MKNKFYNFLQTLFKSFNFKSLKFQNYFICSSNFSNFYLKVLLLICKYDHMIKAFAKFSQNLTNISQIF